MFKLTNFVFFFEKTNLLYTKKLMSKMVKGQKTQTNETKTPEVKTKKLTKTLNARGHLGLDKSKVPYYEPKDLTGFELKPYVSHQTTKK
jgi:hypothetical protein